jgi:hypothetical protein
MSRRVFSWDANPLVDSRLYRISNKRAAEMVKAGEANDILLADGRRAIQLRQTQEDRVAKSIGHGNLVPFGRTYDPLMQPPSINYEIPHAGDLGMRRHFRRLIRVSARKIDLTAAAYMTPARTLSSPNVLSSSLDSSSALLVAQTA